VEAHHTGDYWQTLTLKLFEGPGHDPLRDGFQATSLDPEEVERILDACIQHSDHWSGFKVAAMVLLGTAMGFRGSNNRMQTCHLTDNKAVT